MSTSNTHQQSLADAGSETRPPMLERGSYKPWESQFRRYLNQKRENKKWLNKVINEGLYVFKNYTPLDSQTEDVLTGDDLKHYEAEIKYVTQVRLAKMLTEDSYDDLFDYLSQYEKLVNAYRVRKLEKSHDPLALVAHTGSSS
ncbi:hypothetical protein Tco_1210651, partial [Tanacetum coccineum]